MVSPWGGEKLEARRDCVTSVAEIDATPSPGAFPSGAASGPSDSIKIPAGDDENRCNAASQLIHETSKQ